MKAFVIFFLWLALTPFSQAKERPDHFQGKPSANLEEAFKNLAAHNKKLKKLAQGELSNQDLVEIHKLSYTLENALERIRTEVVALAAVLEEIHVASENLDKKTVQEKTPEYLKGSGKILRRR